MSIERDWITEAGLRAVVLMHERAAHRCGYVAVPRTHPLYGVEYSQTHPSLASVRDETIGKRGLIAVICADEAKLDAPSPELAFDVHGGLTYSGGNGKYPAESDGLWWFGYDCGHAGDAPAPGSKMAEYRMTLDCDDVHRSLDYCVAECESLAAQLVGPRVRMNADHAKMTTTQRLNATGVATETNPEGVA